MNVFNVVDEFQGTFAAVRTSTKFIVVHHAAADYPPYFGRDDVAAIANYHISKGWSGIGYHEVLAQETNNGPIAAYVVSRPTTVRAHVAGRNHECFGICMAANFSRSTPPQQWLDALALRLVEAKKRWPSAQIVGHKDIALPGHATSCPGEKWAAWKPALLAQVESMLRQSPPPVSLPTDDFAAWGNIGLPEGIARSWAIPRAWLANKRLGRCVQAERYAASGKYSIAEFEHGLILYYKARNVALVELF